MSYVYATLQLVVMIALVMPIQIARRAPAWIEAQARGLYYACVQAKRRARGEDEWQEHDLTHLGIRPPLDHPWWRQQPRITVINPDGPQPGDTIGTDDSEAAP